jgi:predicted lipoprotein with Yx(FWY)xxD motif
MDGRRVGRAPTQDRKAKGSRRKIAPPCVVAYDGLPVETKETPMSVLRLLSAAAVAAALLAGCASDRVTAPAEMRGGVMTDWYSHKTLYTFDRDTTNPTVSNCNDACAVRWPPFRPATGESARGDWTVFKRADGSSQWAYKGRPVYFFADDTKTGEMKGEGVNGVWHVLK